MLNHKNWLPEAAEKVELDLEAELRYPLSSATSSRRSSLGDREGDFGYILVQRLKMPILC